MGTRTSARGLGVVLLVASIAAVMVRHHAEVDHVPDHPGGRYVKPTEGRISSRFGPRQGGAHYGLDIAAPTGTPIRAVTDGTVIETGPATGFGLWMRLRHPDGTVTVYGHMHTIDRAQGATVDAGDRIATVGSRGQSTGPHLHFEVWPRGERAARIDPAAWLAARGIRY